MIAVVMMIVAASVLYIQKCGPVRSSASSPTPMPDASNASGHAPAPTPSAVLHRTVSELHATVSALLKPDTAANVRAFAADLFASDEEKRATAIGELGFLDDPRWTPVVIAVLAEDPSAAVRSAAAAALATQSSSLVAVHALSVALTDTDSDVREDVLLSLKAIRNSVVEQDLRQLLNTHQLDDDTAHSVRVLLDRYYINQDPLADPLAN